MNIKDKHFKFNWDFEDLDDYTLDDFRKCNHCGSDYYICEMIDCFRSVEGIKLFGTYILSTLLCYKCANNLICNGKLDHIKSDNKPIQMSFFDGLEY